MKEITLQGFVKFKDKDYFEHLYLDDDGYLIDLISRTAELSDNFGSNVQIDYFVTNTKKTKEELDERLIRKICGAVDAEYETDDYCYSSWTSGTDYNSNLIIGGHDLFRELSRSEGKYLVITYHFKND